MNEDSANYSNPFNVGDVVSVLRESGTLMGQWNGWGHDEGTEDEMMVLTALVFFDHYGKRQPNPMKSNYWSVRASGAILVSHIGMTREYTDAIKQDVHEIEKQLAELYERKTELELAIKSAQECSDREWS